VLAALGIVAACCSVAQLSGAWSRAVPVVSTGARPIPAPPSAAPASMTAEVTTPAPPASSAPPDLAARPGQNRLFTSGLSVSGGRCTLPPYSAAEPLEFLTAAVGCFDHAWAPALTAAGSSDPPVRLRVAPVAGPDQPCGLASTTELARYCDGTIYLMRTGPDRPAEAAGPGTYLEAVAHEYGRHLQHLSGVDAAGSRLRTAVGVEGAGGPLLARRQELQASCLAGLTIADLVEHSTLSSTARDQITRAAAARGDSPRRADQPRLRGSTDSNRHWFTVGYRSPRPTSCNTWLASPAEVN
jgi:hypothetical protein